MIWRSLWLVIKQNCVIVLGKWIVLAMHIFSCHLFLFFCFPPCLGSVIDMYCSSGPNTSGPEFIDPPPFPMTWNVCEYLGYLDSRKFEAMSESGVALITQDRKNITGAATVGAWVPRWLHCGTWDMYFLRCISSEEICSSFFATRKLSTTMCCATRFDCSLGVTFWKYPFL